MSKKDLKRAEIFNYITKMVTEEGYVPSVREICKAVDLNSPATVHYHLNILHEEGLIVKEPNKKRFLKLAVPATENFLRVPIVSKIVAGFPITSQENIEDHILIPSDKVKSKDVFGFITKNDSMINAGIYENDILIIEKTNIAESRDIVVALHKNEVMISRFYKENKYFKLQPENNAYEPIYTTELHILGKVIALHRYLKTE